MNEDSSPYVFIVGCPRSGTTLLQRILDSHPELAVANDTHFIPKFIRHLKPGTDPVLTDELVRLVRSYKRFHRLGLPDRSVNEAAASAKTYGDFVAHLYSQFAAAHGKRLPSLPTSLRHRPPLELL